MLLLELMMTEARQDSMLDREGRHVVVLHGVALVLPVDVRLAVCGISGNPCWPTFILQAFLCAPCVHAAAEVVFCIPGRATPASLQGGNDTHQEYGCVRVARRRYFPCSPGRFS